MGVRLPLSHIPSKHYSSTVTTKLQGPGARASVPTYYRMGLLTIEANQSKQGRSIEQVGRPRPEKARTEKMCVSHFTLEAKEKILLWLIDRYMVTVADVGLGWFRMPL
jgi:ribosomal protein S16